MTIILLLKKTLLQKNVPFTDWFRLDGLSKYHRVILAEDFMATLAQEHWPPGNRTGYCYGYGDRQCEMKKGRLGGLKG